MSTVVSKEFGSFEYYNYHLFTDFAKAGMHFTCKNGKNDKGKYFHLKLFYIRIFKFVYIPKRINKLIEKIFWSKVEKWTKITTDNINRKREEYMNVAVQNIVNAPYCKGKDQHESTQRVYGCFTCTGSRDQLMLCAKEKNQVLFRIAQDEVYRLETKELTKNWKK